MSIFTQKKKSFFLENFLVFTQYFFAEKLFSFKVPKKNKRMIFSLL